MLPKLPALGSAISDIVGPTFAIYEPLLSQRKSTCLSTRGETFTYGDSERQKLDVYYPSESQIPSGRRPVLIWVYGGGFVVGDKSLPGYADGVVYANIGHFFASKFGFTVVVPDYRLVAHGGRFPSGGEDLSLALDWIRLGLTKQEGFSSIDLFLMGNSAGGVHVATYLLSKDFSESRNAITKQAAVTGEGVKLRAVLFMSVPFHFAKAPEERKVGLEAYFGGTDLHTASPVGLLGTAVQDGALSGSDVTFSVWSGTLDSKEEILEPTADFQREWKTLGVPLLQFSQKGHNHMSPQLSLGTGITEEEEWGFEVGRHCLASCS